MRFRRSLAEPIPEIFSAAQLLSDGVDAHLAGDHQLAAALFKRADDQKVWAYTDSNWGAGAKQRFNFVQIDNALPIVAMADRPLPRMPTPAIKGAVVARDGHHCRFCGIPVIDPAVRKLLHVAYPLAVRWGAKNVDQHAAFQCMWLQFDHIVPNSRGGDSFADNIVVACTACNFGRMETTLEEALLVDPRAEIRTDTWTGFAIWDGLERVRHDHSKRAR